MTEHATVSKPSALLEGIDVLPPEQSVTETRLYVCGIRKTEEFARFEFQIPVGPAVFTTQTFEWEGKGENAKQVFRDGALVRLSDAQVKEIREKLQFRYLRPVKNKSGAVTGVEHVDASDGGAIDEVRGLNGVTQVKRPAQRLPGRLRGDEVPLTKILMWEPVYGNPKMNGRVLTVADLKQMLEEAQRDEERMNEGGQAAIDMLESGKGGKRAGAAAPRDPKLAAQLSTTDGKRKADAGFIPDGK